MTAEASNGLEAINLIQSQVPNLVPMDIRMQVMDGLEATKIIKVIILTMYPDCQSEVLSAGADAFLVKGCAVEEMISAILILN